MISKARIEELIREKLEDTDFFVVDLTISPNNKISVELDGKEGFPISECINFSRQIEHNLDREEEDFALEVSSPGLSKPFKVFQQYTKNIGREVNVKTLEGLKHSGVLVLANEEMIQLKHTSMQKIEGKKKKEEIVELINVPFSNIKETKLELIF